MGSINSIRNLDNDQGRLRPLMSLHVDESDIVDSSTTLPEAYRLRKHHTEDAEVDSALEQGMRELDLYGDEYLELEEDHEFEASEVMEMPRAQRHGSDEHSSGNYGYHDSSERHMWVGEGNDVSHH